MKFWNSGWFHTVLHLVGLAGTVVLPIAAANGAGVSSTVLAVGAAAGGVALKLSASPITPQSVSDAVDAAVRK